MSELSSDNAIVYAWDANLLQGLDLSKTGINFQENFSPTNPDKGIFVRPLSSIDFEKGFTNVLAQLTKLGKVSKDDFAERFKKMKSEGSYYTFVVEDTLANNGQGKIVGTGTLEIEQKFIHSCALRGRVEELIIDSEYRDRQLRKIVLGLITELGRKLGCYKVTLECIVEDIEFYGTFGYKEDQEKFMQLRFRD